MYKEMHFNNEIKGPSLFHLINVIIKLIPIAITFRRDRREWVKKEGKNINVDKYKRHAKKTLDTFVSLGPSYIKLGQWLSSRADIMPQPYLEILSDLQDNVPSTPFDRVRGIIEEEIGDINQVFDKFDTTAISAASLGQVYLAVFKKRNVVVKVRRPDIERLVEYDIAILKRLMPLATKFIDPNLRISAEAMLSQFIETIYEEMDYEIEKENLLRIKDNLKDEDVVIPEIVSELSTKKIIIQEYIDGIKITNIEELEKNNINRQRLIESLHYIFFRMLLRDNIFHADPHPGNISVTKNGTIILYDFGMVGRLDDETRTKLIRLYLSLVDKDPSRTVNALMELGTLDPSVNRYVVERAISLSIRALHGRKVERMEVNFLMDLSNKTMSKFPFLLPKNLALYIRMGSILEGIYNYHKIEFKFVRVLSNLLENEGLVKDAYKEEARLYISRLLKNIDDISNTGTLLRTYLEMRQFPKDSSDTRSTLLISLFPSILFIGSCILYSENRHLSYFGFVMSVILFIVPFLKMKKR